MLGNHTVKEHRLSGRLPDVPRAQRLGEFDAAVPRRLRASWLRSEQYGIPLDTVEPMFAGTEAPESLFHACGTEVLVDLHRTLSTEPVGMMLTDSDGVVLSRVSGDHALLRALDRVHLAPGFGYSERQVGTNGLGLALADLAPTLVRADQHYSHSLTGFTCAAAPVVDPSTGRLEGAVNLTTWSDTSSDLLLTLARSAASTIATSMLARGSGKHSRPTLRRSLFRIDHPGPGEIVPLGPGWTDAADEAFRALTTGSAVAALGAPSSGRSALLNYAARRAFPRHRILSATAPAPDDVASWLELWDFEADRPDTVVVVRDADALPEYAAEHLRDLLFSAGCSRPPVAFTAENFEDIPRALASFVNSVVALDSLESRPDDVLPLAHSIARAVRGRDVHFSDAAQRALRNYNWPHQIAELSTVVTHAVSRSDVVDTDALPAEVLAGTTRRLSTIEAFEYGEIVRILAPGKVTMQQAAVQLGMSRATLYRKVRYYRIDTARSI